MTVKESDDISNTIDNEGFAYAFLDYSDFRNVKDAEFHRLRRAFVAAAKELKEFLNLDE